MEKIISAIILAVLTASTALASVTDHHPANLVIPPTAKSDYLGRYVNYMIDLSTNFGIDPGLFFWLFHLVIAILILIAVYAAESQMPTSKAAYTRPV